MFLVQVLTERGTRNLEPGTRNREPNLGTHLYFLTVAAEVLVVGGAAVL
jgi:hypothetical protein